MRIVGPVRIEKFLPEFERAATMATEWRYAPRTRHSSRADKEEVDTSEFKELYERAREATREAQRQAEAQLKAAMAAATAGGCNSIRLSPLSLKFSNARLERAYWQKSSTESDNKDAIPFAFQLLIRVTLISVLLQARQSHLTAATKEEAVFLLWPNIMTRLVSYLWVAFICATVLVVHVRFSSWYCGNRGTILLIAASFLWIGEGIALLASSPNSTCDLVLILIQCIFMSVLHRVPFCLHLKTRALGFGLQLFGAFARVRVEDALPVLLFISMGHSLGIALAYVLDQQSRVGFLWSLPRVILDEISGGDSQLCCQRTPRRALGGFAGGFGGVSSLKGTYAPSFLTVSSSSCNSGAEDVSDCNSSTVENSTDEYSCKHEFFSCQCPSNENLEQSSQRDYTSSVLECTVYSPFTSDARNAMGG